MLTATTLHTLTVGHAGDLLKADATWRPRPLHAACSEPLRHAFSRLRCRLVTPPRACRTSRTVAVFDTATAGARLICIGCCFGALLDCGRHSSLRIGFSPSADTLTPFCAALARPCALTLDARTLSLIGGGSPPWLLAFPLLCGALLSSRAPHATQALALCALHYAPRTRHASRRTWNFHRSNVADALTLLNTSVPNGCYAIGDS